MCRMCRDRHGVEISTREVWQEVDMYSILRLRALNIVAVFNYCRNYYAFTARIVLFWCCSARAKNWPLPVHPYSMPKAHSGNSPYTAQLKLRCKELQPRRAGCLLFVSEKKVSSIGLGSWPYPKGQDDVCLPPCVIVRTRILGAGHPHTLSSRTALLEWQTEMASTSLPNQKFVYDELPDHSIRLLYIFKQENEPNRIVLRLKTYQLNDAPDFNALSYVWGQSPEMHQMLCQSEQDSHAGEITVTSNLFKALPFIKAASSRPIWIDAVCINQGSNDEKSKVVPIMGEYYGKAAEVLIWLGPSGDGSDLAMDVLKWIGFPQERELLQHSLCGPYGSLEPSQLASIFSVLHDGVHITNTTMDTTRLGIPRVGHALWSALPALYQREWFSRVWTFQEIMLATNATVLCGDRAIP